MKRWMNKHLDLILFLIGAAIFIALGGLKIELVY